MQGRHFVFITSTRIPVIEDRSDRSWSRKKLTNPTIQQKPIPEYERLNDGLMLHHNIIMHTAPGSNNNGGYTAV